VPSADVNMQLRSYLTMVPEAELEFEIPQGYSKEFRPSSLLRFKLCAGALNLERALRFQGILDREPSEDAAEGQRLHKAIADPSASRDDLSPEQIDTVEDAEEMAEKFIQFILGSDEIMPFYGAIIQPRVKKQADAAIYTADDIVKSKTEIEGIWDAANEPGAKRVACADACKFCPCKALCPEYRDWVMPPPSLLHRLPVARWTDEQMDLFESKRGELQKFIDDVHEQIKAIKAAQPERLPGWELKDGANVRTVNDLPAAWVALSDLITAKQFSDSCDISLGAIEKIIWDERKNGSNKLTQKEAKALVNVRLGQIIELRQKAPSLVRKNED
jgi:hypothetical protein